MANSTGGQRGLTRQCGPSGRRAVAYALGVAALAATAGLSCQQPAASSSPTSGSAARMDSLAQRALSDRDPNALSSFPQLAPGPGAGALVARPDGNPAPAQRLSAPDEVQATVASPDWVRSRAAVTLWSSAEPNAAAFTQVPAGSYMRVQGMVDGERLPVFYVGDGLLRRPGAAWVAAADVEAVEAPPPGAVPAVDAYAQQALPDWVQAHRATTLWSGPDSQAVTLTDLPQWTFLQVVGLERSGRILVQYAGDYYSRLPGIGWVDVAAVGPSGNPGDWVTNHRTSALWSGPGPNAQRFSDLPQWTKLRIVDDAPADAERMMVEFFGDSSSRLPGVAWIARADVGPITPPNPLPARPKPATAASAPPVQSYAFSSDTDFIETVGTAARRSQQATRVPASVTVAQAILESDWGRSRLARQGNNLFGIKALSAPGPAGVVSLSTWEHVGGSDVMVQQPFKAYYSLEESLTDHGYFFTRNRRYAGALAVASDPRAFAREIQAAGYATDPSYAAKLIRLMDRYNLYRFDIQ